MIMKKQFLSSEQKVLKLKTIYNGFVGKFLEIRGRIFNARKKYIERYEKEKLKKLSTNWLGKDT